MSNSFGKLFKITIFGESHGPALGVVIEGLPPGFKIDWDLVDYDLDRRRPGRGQLASTRQEKDAYHILSGVKEGRATGSALAAIIENMDARPGDYDKLSGLARPSHADYPAHVKYQGYADLSGGGQFSGRLTAPVVFAGALAKDILREMGISIQARIKAIHTSYDLDLDYASIQEGDLAFQDPYFPVLDEAAADKMQETISQAQKEGDSVGGIIEAISLGLPTGLGQPLFDSLESRLAAASFSIPGVRGIEFGAGFKASQLLGSDHNDEYYYDQEGHIKTRTNQHGGALGGMATGMPLVYSLAIKPTPSIGKSQNTVDLIKDQPSQLTIQGRHDPCIVPRAVPVVEAWTALVLLDLMMLGKYI